MRFSIEKFRAQLAAIIPADVKAETIYDETKKELVLNVSQKNEKGVLVKLSVFCTRKNKSNCWVISDRGIFVTRFNIKFGDCLHVIKQALPEEMGMYETLAFYMMVTEDSNLPVACMSFLAVLVKMETELEKFQE